MTERLLAYLLDDVAPAERIEIERQLACDPALRRELERLRSCLEPGLAGEAGEGPAELPERRDEPMLDELAARTCEALCHLQQQSGAPPVLAFHEDAAISGRSSRWHAADLLVAGGSLLLLLAGGMPLLTQLREGARRTSCENNLSYLGTCVSDYAARFGRLPAVGLGDHAGVYALRLVEEGGVPREVLQQRVLCPSGAAAAQVAGRGLRIWVPHRSELLAAEPRQQQQWLRTMGGDYAVRVGAFDVWGAFHEAAFTGSRYEPLFADAPSLAAPGVRSVNHGMGQYVVFQDVSVRFCTDSTARFFACGMEDDGLASSPTPAALRHHPDDHLFLNAERRPAGGFGLDDIVMLRSEYGPLGLLPRLTWLRADGRR